MKVSFLVTFYNQEQYVERFINSVLEINKPFDWELLIGDDGSNDKTVNIIKKYQEMYSNIKLYVTEREKTNSVPYYRMCENRINLIDKMDGDIFLLADGDDYYCDKQFVCEAISIFEHNKDVSTVVFGHRYERNDSVISVSTLNNLGLYDVKRYIKNNYVHCGGMVFRNFFNEKEILKIKKINIYDDTIVLLNNLEHGLLYTCDKPSYSYVQYDNSMYNNMSFVNKMYQNLFIMEIENIITKGKYYYLLLKRNYDPIITTYVFKNQLENNKNLNYVNNINIRNNSVLYILTKWKYLCGGVKSKMFYLVILPMILTHPFLYTKRIIQKNYYEKSNRNL